MLRTGSNCCVFPAGQRSSLVFRPYITPSDHQMPEVLGGLGKEKHLFSPPRSLLAGLLVLPLRVCAECSTNDASLLVLS